MSYFTVMSLLVAELLSTVQAGSSASTVFQTQWEKAQNRVDALRFESYATSQQVEQFAADEGFRARAWDAIQRMGITKLYLEVYRGGHIVSPQQLVFARDWLKERRIDVVGGIGATRKAEGGAEAGC